MRKGTYLLFLTLRRQQRISIGSLGVIDIGEGEYCYVGSAMNGLDSRLKRHFSGEKKIRWHIDRLTVPADAKEAYVSLHPIGECELSAMAERCGCTPVFKGFGCSDCRCATHLFHVTEASKQKLLNMSDTIPFLHQYD
jgi:Uri superfamily endonuclease